MKTKITQTILHLFLLIVFAGLTTTVANATQLSGVYTIDSTQAASATNFRNLNSAITYLTTANVRSDGGPANAAPFGVSGPVTFDFTGAITTLTEQVIIPAIPGASTTNRVIFNGNGRTLQFNCTTTNYSIIRLQGAKHVTIDSLVIKHLNTAGTYAWGVHFYQNADSNTINRCTIDYTLVTSASTGSVGIVMSNSLTSSTTNGANGQFNIISNNYIKGNTTAGGPYYAMTIIPKASSVTFSGNRIFNNIIENVYGYGIYLAYSNSTLIANNIFRNPTKTGFTTMYGIYMINANAKDSIRGNTFTNPFGGATTTTNTYYGIYPIATNTPNGSENVITNNVFYDIRSNGPVYPIYILSSTNFRIYHNTIAIDHAASTSTNPTIGLYHSGVISGIGVDFRNNIISINRGGTGMKHCVNLNLSSNLYTFNNNVYSVTGGTASNNFIGYYNANFQTFAQWRTANGGLFDALSNNMNPNFVNASTGNLAPQEGFINNKGANLLTYAPTDFIGVARTTTPDPGAYEFTPTITTDIGISSIIMPAAPFAAGTIPVNVVIRNSGINTITSATINWSINGVNQTPYSWTGSLAGGAVTSSINIGNATATVGQGIAIVASTSNPNGTTDQNTLNDQGSIADIYCTVPGGAYTLNQNTAATATNFTSLVSFANAVSFGGITGPVTLSITPGTGPYTGQVQFLRAIGSNATNTITIIGNGNTIQANPDVNNCHIIRLNGADNMRFSNFTIKTLNTTYGIGMMFSNRADSNIVDSVIIDFTNSGTSSTYTAFMAFSALPNSTSASTSFHNGIRNIIRNCRFIGNPTGGPYYGVSYFGGTTEYANLSTSSFNYFINNEMINPYVYGYYSNYGGRNVFRGNSVYMTTARTTLTTFYGMNFQSGYYGDTIENNRIYDIYKGVPTNTSTAYGLNFSSAFQISSNPGIVRNNMIYDFAANGVHYGIYNANTYHFHCYHNTVSFHNPSATASGITYAYYNTTQAATTHNYAVRNNIFYINRGGTAARYGMWLNTNVTTSPATFITNNNAYFVTGTGTGISNVGRWVTTDYATLATWQTANTNAFDQNSVYANPRFRNSSNQHFLQPGTDSLNNVGTNLLTVVPTDITGAARTTTPDLGAYEFFVPGADASLTRFSSPLNPVTLGTANVDVILKSFGGGTLTAATIDWQVNGTLQTPYNWVGGPLGFGDSSTASVGTYTFINPGFYNFKAWSSLPNNVMDSFPQNDTITGMFCTPVSGTLTINSAAPASSTNFQSFTSMINALQTCGVGGQVVINVAPGVYNEYVRINGALISGLSAANNIIFNGADSATTRIVYDGSVQRATVLLNGAKHITFRNLTIESTGSVGAFGVLLTNVADSNYFIRCSVKVPLITTGLTGFAGIVSSSNLTTVNQAGNNANYLTVDSCTVIGGYYGITLYNNSAPKAIGNKVTNSVINSAYQYALYAYYQNQIVVSKNTVINSGNNVLTTPYALYFALSDNGIVVTKNHIHSQPGGYGINFTQCLGTVTNRNIIANNMVQVGAGTNQSYGIYDVNNAYTDIAHNAVKNTSADASYISCAYYNSYATNSALYNNLRVHNNIFTAPNGAMVSYFTNTAIMTVSSVVFNYNAHFSTSAYPYRIVNTIYPLFTSYKNAMNLLLPNTDTNSIFSNPTFFSSINLRSISPQLDSAGLVLGTVTDDIDGNPRSAVSPDLGVYEFTKPPEDAGVIAILDPVTPLVPGLNNLRAVIRNFGTSNITSVQVSYGIDTVVRTQTYTGMILPGNTDTVTFNATSGPGSTSNQYNFGNGLVNIKMWTSNPNSVPDPQNLNDTSYTSICGGLTGNFTIDPSGSGPNNFTTIQAAIDKLTCGGVYGPVVFNIANGTYNGQYFIPVIGGTSSTNTIVFKSATNNSANVTITSSTATSPTNFTIKLEGTSYISFRDLTIANTNATFSRVFSFNKNGATNTNCSFVEIRNCILNGLSTTSTADQYAVIFAPAGDNATDITIVNNTINNGSYGIMFGGQNIINRYSPNIRIDSNTVNNAYWASIYLTSRQDPLVRYNLINGLPTYGYYGIYLSGVAANANVSYNTIYNYAGTYGLFVGTSGYYGDPGMANYNNNVINMMSPTVAGYGISVTNSSSANFYNNTIRMQSTSTGSYGYYFSGNTTGAQPQIVASNNVRFVNNLVNMNQGYALYLANANAVSGTNVANNNVYYSNTANALYINGVNYTAANFYTNFRNAIFFGSDINSYYSNVSFPTALSCKPLENNTSIWWVNGRAIQTNLVSTDITGAPRSTQVGSGTPDIGAYEVLPTINPVNAVISDSINYTSTQRIIDAVDTVALLTWGFTGSLPTSISATYHPGAIISDPTNNGNSIGAHYMDVFWRINAVGGSSYSYDLTLKYDPRHIGTVPSLTDIKMAKKTTGVNGSWVHYGSTLTTVDTVNYTFTVTGLNSFSDFTGTSDLSPLPVNIATFEANKSTMNAILNWTTASERNSARFEIERSESGRRFEKVGEVRASGNSSVRQGYTYTDLGVGRVVSNGTAYYRLKIVDADGSFEYSPVRAVNFTRTLGGSLAAYPNPFKNTLNLSLVAEKASMSSVTVFDIFGKVVRTYAIPVTSGDNEIVLNDLESLQEGIYVVSVKADGVDVTGKLIKE